MGVERYTIDSEMSKFTVRVFATGMFSAFGHSPTIAIRDFTGESLAVQALSEKYPCTRPKKVQ